MATYFIDPEAGNDANSGLTFALRKKTPSGIAALAGGDVVRYIASHNPVTAVNGAWVDNTQTVTLSAPLSLTIDPGTAAWTASANVTASATTPAKLGATAARLTFSAGFTTGLAAYRALAAPVDLSGFTAVSFWLQVPTASTLTFGISSITLCSDTVGAVPVHTIPIDQFLTKTPATGIVSNTWYPCYFENGSALSSSIQSIGFVINSGDPGIAAISFNNFEAVHERSHASHISHASVVGKNSVGEPEWYPVRGFSGSTVTLGGVVATTGTPERAYRGISETVPFHVRPVIGAGGNLADRTFVAPTGTTFTNPVTITGGWDRTAMSTQSGETWIGHGYASIAAFSASSTQCAVVDNFGAALTAGGVLPSNATFSNYRAAFRSFAGCSGTPVDFSISLTGGQSVRFDNAVFCAQVNNSVSAGVSTHTFLRGRRVTGSSSTGLGLIGGTGRRSTAYMQVDQVDNCATAFSSGGLGNGVSGVLQGCTFASNTAFGTSIGGNAHLINCTGTGFTTIAAAGTVTETCIAGDYLHNKISTSFGIAETQTAVRVGSTGAAWNMRPTSATACNDLQPVQAVLGTVAVAAGTLVTITCQVRRDNLGVSAGLEIFGANIPGVAAQRVLASGPVNTWETVTITFTPTAPGAVDVSGIAYGGSTFNAYFDALEVTQA